MWPKPNEKRRPVIGPPDVSERFNLPFTTGSGNSQQLNRRRWRWSACRPDGGPQAPIEQKVKADGKATQVLGVGTGGGRIVVP